MTRLNINAEVFTRSVEDVVTREELEDLLASGRQLRIKHGIDATGAFHIGLAANLWKIRELQEAGHKAVIIIGDFTTRIGDPTGRSKTRPVLDPKVIAKNAREIEKHIRKILRTDPTLFELHKNSEWYGKMKVEEFLKLLSMITERRLIERDMFRQRLKEGEEVYMHELIYPVLQGYDSVVLKSDLTIAGSDQLFNEHLGRFFQEKFGQRPQVLITLKILPGLDGGAKMSKSFGNAINLDDSPTDKFGKAMRLLDSLIIPYLETYTDVSMADIKKIESELKAGSNPMEAKLFFAQALVRRYHGAKVAEREREKFLKIFSRGEISEGAAAIKISHGLWNPTEFLVKIGFASSKSDARRLIGQKGVEIDGRVLTSFKEPVQISSGTQIRVGKRRFGVIV